ncbi:MAG: T9SS type B sorting domain-containing protein [Saprospiraceae bacterium]
MFNFDNCDFTDANSTLAPGIIKGNPECVCGLLGNSFLMDGNDSLYVPASFSDLFLLESFTFDFYFTISDPNIEMDIFSTSATCISSDSTMYLKYFGSSNELFFALSSNINNILVARIPLDKKLCWHRFTLVKVKTEYYFYINNELIRRFVSRENIPLAKRNPLVFGANNCSSASTSPFQGQIDEISWINRPLSQFEIKNNYLFPEQIVNKDTTIFLGNSVNIQVGASCGQSVSWTPNATLDLSDSFAPIAQPEESTTYISTINYRQCTVNDTIVIYVVDQNAIDCAQILLPKAFTPNNDNLNDTYGISNLFILEDFSFLEIIDRSGAVLWTTANSNEMWDGTYKGEAVNSGVYMYKVKYKCNGEEFFKVDSFSLIR